MTIALISEESSCIVTADRNEPDICIPISHTENLEQFVTEMLMVNQETDVFIKIA